MSTQVAVEPDLTAWIRFLRAHAAVTRALSGRLETAHGISLRDFDVLIQLFHAPDHRMRRVDLARTVILSPSGITRLLDGLERAGWVKKESCQSDARVTWAVLTEAGLRKCDEARASHHEDIEELFGGRFDEAELAQLGELLGRLPLAGACNTE